MAQVLTTFIAVAGTLLGALLGYQFQRRVADRSDRRAAVLAFTSSANEFLRSQHDWWHRKQENPEGQEHVAARTEAYRLRGLVVQSTHRLRLLLPKGSLHTQAEHTAELISALHRAADRDGLRDLTAEARASLNEFVSQASEHVR